MMMPGPYGIVQIAGDGSILDINEPFAAWLGAPVSEIVGQPLGSVLDVDGEALADALRPVAPGSVAAPAVLRTRADESKAVLVAATLTPEGETVVAVLDGTRQHQKEQELLRRVALSKRESDRLGLLVAASVAFADAVTDDELGGILAEVAKQSFAASSASVHLMSDETFTTIAGHNPLAEHLAERRIPMGERAVDFGRPFFFETPEDADALFPGAGVGDAMEASGTRALIASPITDHQTPIGALACFFDHERRFDEQAEPLIRALAQQSAPVFVRLRLEAHMRRIAMLDEVTLLPNRRLLDETLRDSRGVGRVCSAVLFLDLDSFKVVNDELGHAAGDRLLREIAGRLRSIFRAEDAIARFGGDEFVAVLTGVDRARATEMAERARSAIAQPFDWLLDHLQPTVSIGVAVNRTDAPLPVDAVIRVADRAMYEAKNAGGNRVAIQLA